MADSDDPLFDPSDETPSERASNAKARALEKIEELRMHAELAAVFEGPRKFAAEVAVGLTPEASRDIQKNLLKLEKARLANAPQIIDPTAEPYPEARRLLDLYREHALTTNDYHVQRRPGEVTMVRFLAGEQVETFFSRLQAHFDAGFDGVLEDERTDSAWKSDSDTATYIDALEQAKLNMAERYLRAVIHQHNLFALSTQTADEINIAYITDHIMNLPPAAVVGEASAPPDNPTEKELTWYFKLFLLRGSVEGVEHAMFFTFLQKTDDSFNDW